MGVEKLSYFSYSLEFINKVRELIESEESFAVVEVIRTEGPSALKAGNKLIVKSNGSFEGWIGGFCTKDEIIKSSLEAIKEGTSKFLYLKTCHGGYVYLYIEPVLPSRKLVIIGDNPITYYIKRIGESIGFNVVKVNELKEIEKMKINKNTFVIIATMGEKDHEFAEVILPTDVKYVGIVASKKRGDDIISYLRNKGFSEDLISKIKVPAGININAVSPEEIALSILAEIVKVSREVIVSEVTEEVIDPVCGMTVSKSSPYYSTFNNRVYYFCSKYCKDKFDLNPQIYVK
jgi:xanthine dehydrogenase accessory factor